MADDIELKMEMLRDTPDGIGCMQFSWVPTGQRFDISLLPGMRSNTNCAVFQNDEDSPITHVQVYALCQGGSSLVMWQFPSGPPTAPIVRASVVVSETDAEAIGTVWFADGSSNASTATMELIPRDCTTPQLGSETQAMGDSNPMLTPPLDPGNGGRSILATALQPGDLIFSTTNGWGSAAIRAITGGGPASHVRLYVGTSDLGVPAIIQAEPGAGVELGALDDVMAADSIAVAFRYPGITAAAAQAAADYAHEQLGKPYNYTGVVLQLLARYSGVFGLIVNLRAQDNQTAFCSQLVTDAYYQAGSALTLTIPVFNSPDDILQLDWFGQLEYVGHLKY